MLKNEKLKYINKYTNKLTNRLDDFILNNSGNSNSVMSSFNTLDRSMLLLNGSIVVGKIKINTEYKYLNNAYIVAEESDKVTIETLEGVISINSKIPVVEVDDGIVRIEQSHSIEDIKLYKKVIEEYNIYTDSVYGIIDEFKGVSIDIINM